MMLNVVMTEYVHIVNLVYKIKHSKLKESPETGPRIRVEPVIGSRRPVTDNVDVQKLWIRLRDDSRQRSGDDANEQTLTVKDDALPVGHRSTRNSARRKVIRRSLIDCRATSDYGRGHSYGLRRRPPAKTSGVHSPHGAGLAVFTSDRIHVTRACKPNNV